MQFLEGDRIKNIIVVGDRVLIKPTEDATKTNTGLYLPPGVKEKEPVQTGLVVKAGPGYPIPLASDVDEPWQPKDEVKYLPLQVEEGDTAVYLKNAGHEISYGSEKYMIVPQSAILMLVRDEASLS